MNPAREERSRLSRLTRWAMVLSALGLAVVLAVARRLEPDPRGFGTHTQLGLAPCTFAFVTGHRCPTCGMTTAFAWFVRGRPLRSWAANPAGSLIAPACAALVPWLLAGAARGRPWGSRTLEAPLVGLVSAAVTLTLVFWTIRLVFGGR